MRSSILTSVLFVLVTTFSPCNAFCGDTGWIQPGVRTWYLGETDKEGLHSNAQESNLIKHYKKGVLHVKRHRALSNWSIPIPAVHKLCLKPHKEGPFWIAPKRLGEMNAGDDVKWRGKDFHVESVKAYPDKELPFRRFLPVEALLKLNPNREIVLLVQKAAEEEGEEIESKSNHFYFDCETGILLSKTLFWAGARREVSLSEINYDFAKHVAYAENLGPHTGFRAKFAANRREHELQQSFKLKSTILSRYNGVVLANLSGILINSDQEETCHPIKQLIKYDRRSGVSHVFDEESGEWKENGDHFLWWMPKKDLANESIRVWDIDLLREGEELGITTFKTENTKAKGFSALCFDKSGYLTDLAVSAPEFGKFFVDTRTARKKEILIKGRHFYQKIMRRAIPFPIGEPKILRQPISQTIPPEGALNLRAFAVGNPVPKFEWLKDGEKLVDDERVSGSAKPILNIKNISEDDAGVYTVVVSNAKGEVISHEAVIVVDTVTVHLTTSTDPEEAGAVIPKASETAINQGEVFKLAATPAENYVFVRWDGDEKALIAHPHQAESKASIQGDSKIVAVFKEKYVKLVMEAFPKNTGSAKPALGISEVERFKVFKINATPAEGYRFVKWDHTDHALISRPFHRKSRIALTGPANVIAVFKKDHVALLMEAVPKLAGNSQPEVGLQNLRPFVKHSIKATPIEGFRFVKWDHTQNAHIANRHHAVTSLRLFGPAHVIAIFRRNTANLLLEVAPKESGETEPATGKHRLEVRIEHKLVAKAVEGHKFIRWDYTEKARIANPSNAETTVTLYGPANVVAVFEEELIKLTMQVFPLHAGKTEPARGINYVDPGSHKIKAIARENFLFQHWETSDNASVADPNLTETTLTLSGAATVTAVFKKETVRLKMISIPKEAGSTTPETGESRVEPRTPMEISATPAEGHVFVKWDFSKNAHLVDRFKENTTLTLYGPAEVVAVFRSKFSKIKMMSMPKDAGTSSPANGVHSLERGVEHEISATPAEGYEFIRWDGTVHAHIKDIHFSETTVRISGPAKVIAVFKLSEIDENDEDSDEEGDDGDDEDESDDEDEDGDEDSDGDSDVDIDDEEFEEDVEMAEIGKVIIKSAPNGDSVLIKDARIPDSIKADDIDVNDFSMKIQIDDFELELTEETGALTEKCDGTCFIYKANHGSTKAKLFLNLSNGDDDKNMTWSLRLAHIDLIDKIDSFDGIDILLNVNGKSFGDNIEVDKATRWKYKAVAKSDQSGTSESETTEFNVLAANGRSVNFTMNKDAINIKKGALDAIEDFDPDTDAITLTFDEWSITPDSSTFKKIGRKNAWKCKGESLDGGKFMLILDFSKKYWKFKVSHADIDGDIDFSDGLDVKLSIGEKTGGTILDVEQLTIMKYPTSD